MQVWELDLSKVQGVVQHLETAAAAQEQGGDSALMKVGDGRPDVPCASPCRWSSAGPHLQPFFSFMITAFTKQVTCDV